MLPARNIPAWLQGLNVSRPSWLDAFTQACIAFNWEGGEGRGGARNKNSRSACRDYENELKHFLMWLCPLTRTFTTRPGRSSSRLWWRSSVFLTRIKTKSLALLTITVSWRPRGWHKLYATLQRPYKTQCTCVCVCGWRFWMYCRLLCKAAVLQYAVCWMLLVLDIQWHAELCVAITCLNDAVMLE